MHEDEISLGAFQFDAILGLLDVEQTTPQPLQADVRLFLDLDAAGDRDELGASVDYAAVMRQVRFIAVHGRFRLLESMALAMCRLLLAPPAPQEQRASIARCEIALRKPEVLMREAVPGVRVARDAAWCDLKTSTAPSGVRFDVLVEAGRSGVYRLHVEPGEAIDLPSSAVVQVIAGAFLEGSRTWTPGEEPPKTTKRLVNLMKKPSTLLAVSVPPLGRPTP